jgi:hypothetical protein
MEFMISEHHGSGTRLKPAVVAPVALIACASAGLVGMSMGGSGLSTPSAITHQ